MVDGLPVACQSCGSLFFAPSIIGGSGAAQITMVGNTYSPCPVCQGTGRIIDGVYEMVDDTIRIIASSGYSEDKLQHLLLLVLVPIASASAAPANVAVGSSADGSVLIDGHGKSLYRFGRDTGRKSTCNGERAQNWPPLLTTSTPKAGTSRPGSSARRAGPMANCR